MSEESMRKRLTIFIANGLLSLTLVWLGFYLETIPGLEWMFAPCAFTAIFLSIIGFIGVLFNAEVNG